MQSAKHPALTSRDWRLTCALLWQQPPRAVRVGAGGLCRICPPAALMIYKFLLFIRNSTKVFQDRQSVGSESPAQQNTRIHSKQGCQSESRLPAEQKAWVFVYIYSDFRKEVHLLLIYKQGAAFS